MIHGGLVSKIILRKLFLDMVSNLYLANVYHKRLVNVLQDDEDTCNRVLGGPLEQNTGLVISIPS